MKNLSNEDLLITKKEPKMETINDISALREKMSNKAYLFSKYVGLLGEFTNILSDILSLKEKENLTDLEKAELQYKIKQIEAIQELHNSCIKVLQEDKNYLLNIKF